MGSVRCTVPCRDHATGAWLFPDDMLKLWKELKKVFPEKAKNPDWGSWAGVCFGVYFGTGGREGTLRVGDCLVVTKRQCSSPSLAHAALVGAVLAALAVGTMSWLRQRRA